MDKNDLGAGRPSITLAIALFLGLAASACSSGDEKPQTACSPGSSSGCPSGQICSDQGICTDANTTPGQLALSADGARACEILLSSDTVDVVKIVPGAGVDGVLRARPPRYAIAIASTSGALPTDAVGLELNGEPGAVSVAKVECFDDTGAPIPSASASID